MQVKLSTKERKFLECYAKHVSLKRSELLRDFITDLCGIIGNGGSDERDYALEWFKRRYGYEIYENQNGDTILEIPSNLWQMEEEEIAETR